MENSKITVSLTRRGNVQINFNVSDSGVIRYSADGYYSFRNLRGPVTKIRLTVSKPQSTRGMYNIHRETFVDGTIWAEKTDCPWNRGEKKICRSRIGVYNKLEELFAKLMLKVLRVCKDFGITLEDGQVNQILLDALKKFTDQPL